jgi:hypothetical protein
MHVGLRDMHSGKLDRKFDDCQRPMCLIIADAMHIISLLSGVVQKAVLFQGHSVCLGPKYPQQKGILNAEKAYYLGRKDSIHVCRVISCVGALCPIPFAP